MKKDLGFFEAYKIYWKNTFKMKGRARRLEYWSPVIINTIIAIILIVIGSYIDTANGVAIDDEDSLTEIFNYIWGLINFIPLFTVTARRLQDININGWWVLFPYLGVVAIGIILVLIGILLNFSNMEIVIVICIVYFITTIVYFIFTLIEGTLGPNKFGEDPKRQMY